MNLICIDINKKYWEWIIDGQVAMKGDFINYTKNDLRLIITTEHHEMDFPLNQFIIDYIKK